MGSQPMLQKSVTVSSASHRLRTFSVLLPHRPLAHSLPRRVVRSQRRLHCALPFSAVHSPDGLRGGPEGVPQTSSIHRADAGPGSVFLVGTGPGDPGLLTMRSVHLMQTADVVLYDRLVSDDILQLVHGGALMVYVGKSHGFHTRTQDQIHALLLYYASAGANVVRLKGGDPSVFGRGGEEKLYLEEHGIPAHIIPGVTAASGICAELGIPLTHRGVATSVRYLTGHAREGGEGQLDETTATAVDPHTTLVIYMGLQTLPSLMEQLLSRGLSPDTPAAAIERGTTPEQRVVYAPLDKLAGQVNAASLQSPTLIVIGQVVGLCTGWKHAQRLGVSVARPGDTPSRMSGALLTSVFEQAQEVYAQRAMPVN